MNLNFQQEFRLPKNLRATVAFNIDNLFDQETVTSIGTAPYRDALKFNQCSAERPRQPRARIARSSPASTPNAVMARSNAAAATSAGRPDPRYKMDSGWQGARQARLQVRFSF